MSYSRKEGIFIIMKKVLFLGDSITDNNVYPSIIEACIRYKKIDGYEFYNVGLSSENVCGLTEDGHPFVPRPNINERIERVLDTIKPNVIFILYGINDGIYRPFSEERFVAFREGYNKLLDVVRSRVQEVIACTTTYFDMLSCKSKMTEKDINGTIYKYYDEVMKKYSEYIKTELAVKSDKIIDMHGGMSAFIEEKRKVVKYDSGDGIHPNFEVSFAMADIILRGYFEVTDACTLKDDKKFKKIYKCIYAQQNLAHYYYKEAIGHTSPYKSPKTTLRAVKFVKRMTEFRLKRLIK